jgi:hypothetical protein
MRSFAISLVAIFHLAACGGGNDDIDGGDGASTCSAIDATLRPENYDPSAIARSLAEAECDFYTRCQPATYPFLGFSNAGDCTAQLATRYTLDFELLGPAIASGRIAFNSGNVDQCAGELRTMDCDLGQSSSSACTRVTEGQQDAAGACFLTAECDAGFYCKRASGIGSGGTCAPAARRGEDCTATDGACELDNVCAQAEGGIFRCVATDRGENDGCGTSDTGICRGTLMCVGADGGAGTCKRPVKAVGESCDLALSAAADCDLGNNLSCTNGQCATVTAWNGAGGACSATEQCDVASYCPDGGAQCTTLPNAGETCAENACRQGAFCDGSNTCVGERAMGMPCGASFECGGNLACIGLSAASDGQCGTLSYMLCN